MASQDNQLLSLFSAAEVEFLAEDELINIVPSVRMDTLHMICVRIGTHKFLCLVEQRQGDYGPFRPQIPAQVPLWLGVALKKRGKCRIQPPDWMTVEKLTQVLEDEREAPREFQPLPFHYVEISRLLFDHSQDDISDFYLIRSLVEDIRDVRFHKVEKGLETLSGRTHAVKLKNLSAMEVNLIRPFIVKALESFYKHDSEDLVKQVDSERDSQLAAADRLPRRTLRPR